MKKILIIFGTRPEAIEAGVAKLVGTNPNAITDVVQKLLHESTEYQRMSKPSNPFGDGKASERIVNILLGRPYEPFQAENTVSDGRI